jgi:quercetin 2,3-dioxygenase
MPEVLGWDGYVYVYEGAIEIEGIGLTEAESGLSTDPGQITLQATRPSLMVVFLVNPDAGVTYEGTVGQ